MGMGNGVGNRNGNRIDNGIDNGVGDVTVRGHAEPGARVQAELFSDHEQA